MTMRKGRWRNRWRSRWRNRWTGVGGQEVGRGASRAAGGGGGGTGGGGGYERRKGKNHSAKFNSKSFFQADSHIDFLTLTK